MESMFVEGACSEGVLYSYYRCYKYEQVESFILKTGTNCSGNICGSSIRNFLKKQIKLSDILAYQMNLMSPF